MIKKWIKRVDNALLGQRLRRFMENLRKIKINKKLSKLESKLDYKFVVYHNKNNNLISQLCDQYGSDKGEIKTKGHPYPWPSHTYADFYSRLFSHCKDSVTRVFECGLGTNNPHILSNMGIHGKPGASLRVWRDYFPNATIVGADIDRDILFQEERIKTFYMDQLNPMSINTFWQQAGVENFDLMIDDGLHTFPAGSCLFENSISKLAPHGIYIIEDVYPVDLVKYRDFFSTKNFSVDYVRMFRPTVGLGDNSLVVIRGNAS